MVLEERAVDGYSSSDGRYTGGNSGSAYPPNMGPGAIMSSQPELGERGGGQLSVASMLQQVQEIRSHYSFEVRDRALFLGYDLNGAARRYSLPFASMPLSGLSFWLLYGGPMRTRVTSTFVIDTIRGAENLAHRPLTQTEAEGFAHHASRRTLYSFATSISALWIGSIFAIAGRKTMKFPFRKAQPLERYDNFPNRWLPVLRGHYARLAWQIARFNVYTILSLALIAPIYSSMGDSAMMVGLYKDQRTHDVTKAMAASLRKTSGRLQRHASNRPGAAQPPSEAGETGGQDDFYTSAESGVAKDNDAWKGYNGDTASSAETTATDLLGNPEVQGREVGQPSPSSFSGTPVFRQKSAREPNPAFRRRPVPQSDHQLENSSDPDFIFDDASPTAGNGPDVNANTGSSRGGGGSAWERIRTSQTPRSDPSRSAPPRQSSQPSSRDQPGRIRTRDDSESSPESFSFSSGERDGQLAKEQAQKDFDRMLEEERKIGEEGSAIGSGGAWSRRRRE